jgi:hypothetical protein
MPNDMTIDDANGADNSNVCVICLEPLSAGVIGAATPCGHCFHEECFDGWRASKLGNNPLPWYEALALPPVKCPLCAKETRDFCRLYLDLGELGDAGDGIDNDESSLSSSEGDGGKDEDDGSGESAANAYSRSDDGDRRCADNKSATASSSVAEPEDNKNRESHEDRSERSRNKVDNLRYVEVVELLDDDDDDNYKEEPSQQPQHATKPTRSSDSNKYRAKAKQLKRRVKMLEVQRAQQSEELRDIQERYGKNRNELAAIRKKLEEIASQIEFYEREREGTSLELVQLRREKQELSSKLEKAAVAKDKAERHLADARKDHARELQKAQAFTMTEVQNMLNDQPRLIQENRELKQLLTQYRQTLREAQSSQAPAKRVVTASSKTLASSAAAVPSNGALVGGPPPLKSAPLTVPVLAIQAVRQMGLQDARQMQAAAIAAQTKKKMRREKEERNASFKAELQGKLSAHAARLSTSAASRHAAGGKPNPIHLLAARLDDENASSRAQKRPSALFQTSLQPKKVKPNQPPHQRERGGAFHPHRPPR